MASSSGCVPEPAAPSSHGGVGKGASVSPPEPPAPGLRFPRTCRLTARREYLAVYARGRRMASKSFTLFGLPNELDTCRLGLTVTRKFGGAARRNRAKRLLREVFRLHRHELSPALDLVVNPRPNLRERTLSELEAEFLSCFRRLARGLR